MSAVASRRAPCSRGSARAARSGCSAGSAASGVMWRAGRSGARCPAAASRSRRIPALLGVGYVVGTRIALVMLAGGVLSYCVLIPAIHLFGPELTSPLVGARRVAGERGCRRARCATPSCSTSAPARSGPAASSRCCGRCPRSGAPSARAWAAVGDLERPRASAPDRDLPMTLVLGGTLALGGRDCTGAGARRGRAHGRARRAVRLLLRDGVEPHHRARSARPRIRSRA